MRNSGCVAGPNAQHDSMSIQQPSVSVPNVDRTQHSDDVQVDTLVRTSTERRARRKRRIMEVILLVDAARTLYPISALPGNAFWRADDERRSSLCSAGRLIVGTAVGRYNQSNSNWYAASPMHGHISIEPMRVSDAESIHALLSNGVNTSKCEIHSFSSNRN